MVKKIDFDKVDMLAIKHCWSFTALARHAGIGLSTLVKLRKGKTGCPSNNTVGKLCKALECNPQDILINA